MQRCKRDLSLRDRDIRFLVRDQDLPAIPRDRDVWFLPRDRDWDLARPRPRCFSRPSTFSIVPKQWMATFKLKLYKKLTRRWDSERELFYDDIVRVEASAYAYWTDFLISTKHRSMLRYPSNRVLSGLARPTSCAAQWMCPLLQETHQETWSLKWRPLPPLVLPK